MYSLTVRVRVTTPRSMDEMEGRTQQARRFYPWPGKSLPACVVRATACGGPGRLPITAGLCHAFLVLPYQRNPCTDCKSAQQCPTRGHALPLPQVTSGSVQ